MTGGVVPDGTFLNFLVEAWVFHAQTLEFYEAQVPEARTWTATTEHAGTAVLKGL